LSSPSFSRPPYKRKKPFDLHTFLMKAKFAAFEIAVAIVFFLWLIKAVAHELGH
jgi:hypothetical protein